MYLDAIVVDYNENEKKAKLLQICEEEKCKECKGELFCKQKNLSFNAKSNITLNKGDTVKVYLEPKRTVFSIIMLFGLPLLFMYVFIILGQHKIINLTLSYILTLLSLVISFSVLFFINKKFGKKFTPIVQEVYDNNNTKSFTNSETLS